MLLILWERASGRLAGLAAVLWLGLGAMVVWLGPYGQLSTLVPEQAPPEERFGGTGAAVTAYLEALGPGGRELYRQSQLLDFLNPLLLAGAAVLIVCWGLRRTWPTRPGLRYMGLVPVAAGVADAVENVLMLSTLGAFPGAVAPAAAVAMVSTIKLALVAAVVLLIAFGLLVMGARAMARRGG